MGRAAPRQAEIDRVRRMTGEERVKAVFGMASRFAALQPAPRKVWSMTISDAIIQAAEEIAAVLQSRGVGAVVIGAVALAAHLVSFRL